jgi:hypothetical protein
LLVPARFFGSDWFPLSLVWNVSVVATRVDSIGGVIGGTAMMVNVPGTKLME